MSTPHPQATPTATKPSKRRWLCFGLFVLVLWLAGRLLFGWGLGGRHLEPTVAQTPTKKTYEPVSYDVEHWQDSQVKPKPFADIQALTAPFGLGARKQSTLDANGDSADAYHYHSDSEPPLYVVDSPKLFEVAWYYASPKDSEQDQTTSQKYAQSAYALLGQIIKDPKPLFADILAQKNAEPPKGVIFAQCKNYLCQVVLEKDKF